MTLSQRLTGGEVVARTLRDLGADTLFTVSGNQILPIFDAAPGVGLRIVHMRHESAAAYAAQAYADVTGRPGVVLVSAGPGFLAAATGIACARSAELPLLFLSGDCATTQAGLGGFQDVDQTAVAAAICKATQRIESHSEISATVRCAWALALSGVPGPVHVSLPADVLTIPGDVAHTAHATPVSDLDEHVTDNEGILLAMAARLMHARRPLIVARPSANRGLAREALWSLSRHLGVEPVIAECPRGLSDLKYRGVIRQYPSSDCVLAIAPGDFAVGFLEPSAIASRGALLHIDAPGDSTPRRTPDLSLRMSAIAALQFLSRATAAHRPPSDRWYVDGSDGPSVAPTLDGAMHPLAVASEVCRHLRPDDIIVLDGGEFCQWLRLGLRDVPNPILWNTKFGAIGGSIPLALGCAAASGGRVIACVGDGAFGYHAAEIDTAVRCDLPILVIVGNDARWGAEWHLQVTRYGADHTYGTHLLDSSYDTVARGLEATGYSASDPRTLGDAIRAALASRDTACINVRIASIQSPAVADTTTG